MMHSDAASAASATMLVVDGCSRVMRDDAGEKPQDDNALGRAVGQTNFSPISPYPLLYSAGGGVYECVRGGEWGRVTDRVRVHT